MDTVSYAASPDVDGQGKGVEVDLSTLTGDGGHAEGDVLLNVKNLVGSAFNDDLTGDAQAEPLEVERVGEGEDKGGEQGCEECAQQRVGRLGRGVNPLRVVVARGGRGCNGEITLKNGAFAGGLRVGEERDSFRVVGFVGFLSIRLCLHKLCLFSCRLFPLRKA